MEKTQAEIEAELYNYQDEDKIISSHEFKEKFKSEPLSCYKFKYLIPRLDLLTEGAMPGEVITVSGKTKCGKTSVCQTFTNNFALQGIPCLWFTYEIPVRYFLEKFQKDKLPVFYLPEMLKESSLQWIEKRIIESKIKFQVQIVFIDHLHYLIPLDQSTNVSLMIGGVMRELKKMAIRNDVVIFLIAHIGKVAQGEKPGLDSIRDSSFVAQESDFVFMINRPDIDEDNAGANLNKEAKLRVLANRRTGDRGCIDLYYQDNIFKEVSK